MMHQSAVPLDILIGPEHAGQFLAARIADLTARDLIHETIATRLVCEAATDGDPWILADPGQVWIPRPDVDPGDAPPGLLYIVRRTGAEILAEDAYGQRETIGIGVLDAYQLDHWYWAR